MVSDFLSYDHVCNVDEELSSDGQVFFTKDILTYQTTENKGVNNQMNSIYLPQSPSTEKKENPNYLNNFISAGNSKLCVMF